MEWSSHDHSVPEQIARMLRGYKAGNGWMCRCPANDDTTPSLSVLETSEGKLLVHCHAGCPQDRVISSLRSLGLWETTGNQKIRLRTPQGLSGHNLKHSKLEQRTAHALDVWCNAKDANDTPVQTYLTGRGISLTIPSRIKFIPNLRHRNGEILPAMIGLVTAGVDDRPIAIHRTWLTHDGRNKATVKPNKMLLGPSKGGAVRLSHFGQPLLIGEGIETTLSAMQASGFAGWASLSTSGMRALELPPDARDIIILADGDFPGGEAAEDCAKRWTAKGRRVRIARPPQGLDFNDVLCGICPVGGGDPR